MAPIQGHLIVPKALRIFKFALSQAKSLVRTTATTSSSQAANFLNPTRTYTQKSIAIHTTALFKQSKPSRLRTDGTRLYSSTSKSTAKFSGPKYDRSSFPCSRASRAITQKGAVPFASALRPNLTGGTLPRSAGGYSLGGAGTARRFSHTSGCQAQVVQNVSAGIRAFFVSGSKARFDGVDPVTGEKRWKTVTMAQDKVAQNWQAATAEGASCPRGTSLEFQISPTITALLPLNTSESASTAFNMSTVNETASLNTPGLLQGLSADFARALRDLALISHDLTKLAAFGDLPISLGHSAQGPLLRVRFPGCDADAVMALCDEARIRRGVIVEDPTWAESRDTEMALLFPFAPADSFEEEHNDEDVRRYFGEQTISQQQSWHQDLMWRRPMSFTPTSASVLQGESETGELSTLHYNDTFTPSLPEGSDDCLSEIYFNNDDSPLPSSPHSPPGTYHRPYSDSVRTRNEDFEGMEGIYRFLSAIDDARRS